MNIQRGFRDKLDKYINTNKDIEVQMSIDGNAEYDFCCFGVDAEEKLSDDRYMIFFNQDQSPKGEITYTFDSNKAKFVINLDKLPASISKLIFTASIDGNGIMSEINSHNLYLKQGSNVFADMSLNGHDFENEKAVISIEIYKKDVWRFAVVARGFNGGLSDLLHEYGGEELSSTEPQEDLPLPGRIRKIPDELDSKSALPNKVELKKGQKVNLQKKGSSMGEILINLNWSQPESKGGLFARKPAAIDLDLGCLFELKDGTKGCVQALGNAFGSLTDIPYVMLDGDDRTGNNTDGENLRINGAMIPQIKRLLIYTFIYEGAADWYEAKGVVTVKCPGSQDIIVRMDEYGSGQKMCAIALMENYRNETLSVEKIVKFYNGHIAMDNDFNWGLKWVPGRK